MDAISILGLAVGLGGILFGNWIEGGQFGSLMQGAAAFIVFGGTIGAVLLSSKREDLFMGLNLFKRVFREDDLSEPRKILSEIIECAKLARRETILAIEPRIVQIKNPFLQSVLKTVVDGVDPHILRDLFEKQIEIEEEKLFAGSKIWMDAGGFSPTIGIIGAVLGLIHVMSNLSDTSKLGSGIATAFVATIYGIASANLFFLPIGNKIKRKVGLDIKIKEMILEGGLCIQSGISPQLIEIKLWPYIEATLEQKGNKI